MISFTRPLFHHFILLNIFLAIGCTSDTDTFQNYISSTEKPQLETHVAEKEGEEITNPEPKNTIPENLELLESTDDESKSNNLILTETFDEVSILPSRLGGFYKEFATDHAFSIDEIIKRRGRSSGRFEIRKNDPILWGGTRSEIAQTKDMTSNEGWYGFSQYFPESFISDTSEEVVGQWHDVPDKGEIVNRSPSNSIIIQDDTFKWQLRWDTDKIMNNGYSQGHIYIDLGNVPKNQWVDWIVHIKFAHDNTGILEVWKDGVKVIDRQNLPNSYNDDNYPYFKAGIYKWSWGGISQKIMYWDQIRIGDENSSYTQVDPNQ